jgi:hypothetical protein
MATYETIDQDTEESVSVPSFSSGEQLVWKGQRVEVVDVMRLGREYEQVVLRMAGRDRFPVSVPATDLLDAERLLPVRLPR